MNENEMVYCLVWLAKEMYVVLTHVLREREADNNLHKDPF